MGQRSKNIARWTASLLAVALVAAIAWFLWKVSRPSSGQHTTVVLEGDRPDLPRRGRRGPPPEAPKWFQNAAKRWSDADAPEGVRQLLGSYWRVKSAGMIMEVEKQGEDARISFRYLALDFATPELRALFAAAREARGIKPRGIPDLTAAQVEQLKAQEMPEGAVVAAADHERAKSLWKAWETAEDAAKPAAEKALVDALAQIAAASREPTKLAYLSFADKARTILTAQQIQAFSQRTAR